MEDSERPTRSHPCRAFTVAQIKSGKTFPNQLCTFKAILLTYPQTSVISSQITQALYVFEEDNPNELLIVVLSEPAVRKYCNQLKPFLLIEFHDGVLKQTHLKQRYVLISKDSSIRTLDQREKKQIAHKSSPKIHNSNPIKNCQSTNFSNVIHQIIDSLSCSSSSSGSIDFSRVSKSERIMGEVEEQQQQLANFLGYIVGSYWVGKGKANHGMGYQVELESKQRVEVVIWCEMRCDKLLKGQKYEFKNFRKHTKKNKQACYHSHWQHSKVVMA